jgi:hypothetical protein
MHGEFHIPDFIIPHPQPAPKRSHPIKGMSRMYILPGGYAVNKLGVCLNPVPVYTFQGNLIFIHLAVAQFLDGKLSFDVHYEINGESYNGYAASYTNRQAYISVKCAVKVQLNVAIEFLMQSLRWIESNHKRVRIIAETEQIKEDIKALFVIPQQISLF